MSKNRHSSERRQFRRFAVLEGMIEPITISFDGGPRRKKSAPSPGQPAVLTNLSAGGMSLILFMEPPQSKRLEMLLNLPGLEHMPVEGTVVRLLQKGGTYNVGIAFTQISRRHQERIDQMARDNGECDSRISLNLPDACVPSCIFNPLCAKPQKAPHWPSR